MCTIGSAMADENGQSDAANEGGVMAYLAGSGEMDNGYSTVQATSTSTHGAIVTAKPKLTLRQLLQQYVDAGSATNGSHELLFRLMHCFERFLGVFSRPQFAPDSGYLNDIFIGRSRYR